ncbi:MAG: glycosyltransferase family 2 protein [Lactobacillales bacterium]|nr:glycosyltransferase family 2 protein [Lactobacillales bacterium]
MKKFIFYGAAFLCAAFIGIAAFFAQIHWNTPKVSVVMPTYNRADLLPRAIESILTQTYRNFEFIIVDDGSTDASADIIQMYAAIDPRIKYIKNEKNRGISFSRNRGNDLAAGKYIMIMDSDDISLPRRMERMVSFFENHPDVVLLTSLKTAIGGHVLSPVPMDQAEALNLFGLNIGHPEWMLRRSFLKENNIKYSENFIASGDYDYLIQILKKHGQIGYLDEILYLRRFHHTNPKEYYDRQEADSLKRSEEFLIDYGIPEHIAQRRVLPEIMPIILRENKTKRYLNQERLEQFYNDFLKREGMQ